MTRFRTVCLALSGTAAMFALTAAPAHAAPGDVSVTCSSVLTPTGFVDVSWGYSSSCGTSSFAPNQKSIKQLTGLPVGTVVSACSSTYQPAGWIQTSFYYSSSCNYSSVPSLNNNAWQLKRVS
ncbi:hypothetical protein [Streptomyces fragilis]|uniref:Secreted protein n=1 Tax=Streptomyces fragilis TaxID=67301 RepID=A0ABV2YEW0_9ACTN|nr:hypothetical protein [Streptomyces fragilis]